jgi:hypothetical protein
MIDIALVLIHRIGSKDRTALPGYVTAMVFLSLAAGMKEGGVIAIGRASCADLWVTNQPRRSAARPS